MEVAQMTGLDAIRQTCQHGRARCKELNIPGIPTYPFEIPDVEQLLAIAEAAQKTCEVMEQMPIPVHLLPLERALAVLDKP